MTTRSAWLNIAIIICIAGSLMFSYLGGQPLLDPDEPVYAETAREMIQFHDFISPRIYGNYWYDKPPMYYWLVAGAFKAFGDGEFAARFPSALLAVGGAVLVYLSGRKLFNERAGLLAALVSATSLEYFYLGNAAVTDMTLTFFLTAALLSFLHRNYYLLYAFAALAVVTKGPVGIFFCGTIIGAYLLVTGSVGELTRMKLIRGAGLFCLIALPWYLAMYAIHGMAFIDTFLGFHNVTRFLQPEHPSGTLWYFYLPVLIIGFFPWTAFLGQAVWTGIREAGGNRQARIFLVLWAAIVFLFFSASQTKLVSYILPMYPPLALLVGWYFDKAWTEQRYGSLKGAAAAFVLTAILFAAGLLYAGTAVSGALLLPIKVLAGFLALLACAVAFYSLRGNFRAVFATHIAGMMLFTTVLMTQILPVVVPGVSVKAFAGVFKQHYDGTAPVYVAKFYRPGFMYYSGRPGVELDVKEELQLTVNKQNKAYFIMQKSQFEKAPAAVKDSVQILAVQEDKILFVKNSN